MRIRDLGSGRSAQFSGNSKVREQVVGVIATSSAKAGDDCDKNQD